MPERVQKEWKVAVAVHLAHLKVFKTLRILRFIMIYHDFSSF